MPTIARNTEREVYVPVASSVTITPGAGGYVDFSCSATGGQTATASQRIHAATTVSVPAGSTMFVRAVNAAGEYTEPAGNSTALASMVQADGIADLVEPFCIAHRGAGCMVAPEGTREAYELARSYGTRYVLDGGDYYDSADGGLVDCHNGTDLSQITNLTGAVSAQTITSLRRCTVTAATFSAATGSANQTGLLTAADVAALVRGKCFAPEPKTTAAAQILAAELAQLGVQPRCLVNSFTDAHFEYFRSRGFTFLARNVASGAEHTTLANATTGAARCAALKSLGVNYVILDEADANFTAAVAVCVANGMKVGAYTSRTSPATSAVLIKQYQRTQLEGLGLSFYVSDDPLYFMGDTAKYRRTTDPWAVSGGSVYHGHHNRYYTRPPTTSTKLGTVVSGKFKLSNSDTNNNWVLMGWACPIANAASSYTIAATVTLTALPADLTRWIGLAICCPDDRAYTDTGAATYAVRNDGYQIWLVPSNGTTATLNVARKNDGTGTNIATAVAMSGALSAGQTVTLTIAVTPTTITVTVSGAVTGTTGALSDSTWRGGYFHIGHAAVASGTLTADWGPISIT